MTNQMNTLTVAGEHSYRAKFLESDYVKLLDADLSLRNMTFPVTFFELELGSEMLSWIPRTFA